MKGNATALKGKGNGKYLKSTENDNVFMYFNDHGAPGAFCFPVDCNLYADDLISAIKYMHANKMYARLVFYMESCYSGSMFVNLPTNLSVYATTAANP